MELQNKIVLITGASMGIGAATAREFVHAGAKVALAARSKEALSTLVSELGKERALAVPTDITDQGQVDSLVKQTLDHFGKIDILVNNAGVGLAGHVSTLDTSQFEQIFAVNVLGAIYAIKAVTPPMRQAGGGMIINVSSMVSKLVIPSIGGYRATKMALNALSDNARMELKLDNIRVITVYPAQTATMFFENMAGQNGRDLTSYGPAAMQSADFVARRIVSGARKEPREIFMTVGHQIICFIATVFPGLFQQLMAGQMPK
jgi:NADP-dependent 3-hydroxy acid dehydrogenase YdfG